MKPQDFMNKIRGMSDEELAKKVAPFVIGGLGLGGAYLHGKLVAHKDKTQVLKNRQAVVGGFEDPKDQAKAEARFDEIAELAPSAAKSTSFMKKMVTDRLHVGLSSEDAQRLAILESNAKPRQSTLIPKVASIRPRVAGEIYADIYLTVKTAAPSMKWLGDKLSGNTAKMLALFTLPGLSMAAAGGAAKMVSDKLDRKKLENQLEQAFQKAMDSSDPDKEPLKSNPEKARQAFQAMAHFAPHVAVQPDAARAFMSKIVAYDQGINVGDIRDLSEIEKNISSTSPSKPFLQGFAQATASGMGKVLADPYVSDYSDRVREDLNTERAEKGLPLFRG